MDLCIYLDWAALRFLLSSVILISKENAINNISKGCKKKMFPVFEKFVYHPQPTVEPQNHFIKKGLKGHFRGRIGLSLWNEKLFLAKSYLLVTNFVPKIWSYFGENLKKCKISKNRWPLLEIGKNLILNFVGSSFNLEKSS